MKPFKRSDLLCAVIAAVATYSVAVEAATGDDMASKISALATNENRYVALKSMPQAERETLQEGLRARISSRGLRIDSEALQMLVDMGDGQTLKEARTVYTGSSYVASVDMQRHLQGSSQPTIISLVAPDLFREEPSKMVIINSEFIDYPLSVRSAEIIRRVLTHSPEFSEEVRMWAATLSSSEADQMREALREWWVLNKERIEQKNYGAVTAVNLTNRAPAAVAH